MHSDDSSSLPTPTDSSYSSPFQPPKFILSFFPVLKTNKQKMIMNLNLKKSKHKECTHTPNLQIHNWNHSV